MSRGLSRIQQAIVGLLRGEVRRNCYSGGGSLTTGELAEELEALGLVDREWPKHWRQSVFVVRRACRSLLRRGLVTGKYERCNDPPVVMTIEWTAVRNAVATAHPPSPSE